MPGVLLCCSVHQAHTPPHPPPRPGPTPAGVILCRSAGPVLKGSYWVGSYSVVQRVKCLMGQPLYCSAADAGIWGREAIVMAPLPACDLAFSPCFHGCPAFPHRHFPRQSPPSHSPDLSLCSQQLLSPWDCSTIPKPQLPAAAPSRVPASLSRVCMAVARTV